MKSRNLILFLLLSLGLLISSCEKGGLFDCFRSTGKITVEERYAENFKTIILKNNIDLEITQGNDYAIRVEAGKNLQKDISTVINDGVLTISNDNQCNWARSYDKPIIAHLTVKDLDNIQYYSSGNIDFKNTLDVDSLFIEVWEGGGSIRVDINARKSIFYVYTGTVDLTARGYSNVNYILSNGYGPMDCLELETAFTYMSSMSTNDCYVWATLELVAEISNVGDIYYKGDPVISSQVTGSGRLIKLE